jgi:putative spermidine/putrescine transport system ATP-binding protein
MTRSVSLRQVSKSFDTIVAVDNVDLEIEDGEFFSMLGPSGSGKTTCLRMIAGFETPTSGRVHLHGEDVTDQPPYERDVNTVFQDFALFPHMTVAQNVGYGLMVKKVSVPEARRRVDEALGLVRLQGFEGRKPSQLSGGQRQRVALARALVNRPSVLLLDEPLGALDLKLRQAMQVELKLLQREVGITFIFVTHDQEEALTMSDRMAVFNHGKVEQVGTPAEVYENPANEFVAGFVGVSNIVSGNLALLVRGSSEAFTVRPEKIALTDPARHPEASQCAVDGVVDSATYLGAFTKYRVTVGATHLVVISQNAGSQQGSVAEDVGKSVRLVWDKDSCRPLAGTTEPTPVNAGVSK